MNTIGTSYGKIYNLDNQFRVTFWNPTLQKTEFDKRVTNENEAIELLNNYNFDFFSNHSYLLPKGISINKRDRNFRFFVVINKKPIYVFQHKDLDVVNKAKLDFINKLI